jgi:pilus assembly protein Flp/PilA
VEVISWNNMTGGRGATPRGIHMKSSVVRFLRDESGATAIEYGLIAAGISVAIIATVNTLGGQLKNTFSNVSSQLGNAGH